MSANPTLLLLIRSWANRLERELALLDDAMPGKVERTQTSEYVGPTHFLLTPTEEEKANPANWRMRFGRATCLLGLQQLMDELRQAESDLAEAEEAT